MNRKKSDEIITILKEVIPNPGCELNYNNLFELIVAVSLSAQTTDKRVNSITPILFNKYPSPEALGDAELDDVINIIKSLGFANNKAKNIIARSKTIHDQFNDQIPSNIELLTTLPGVGRKTALVVLAEGFKIPALPVDTHLIRMASRLGYSKSNDPVKVEEDYKKYIRKEDWIISHHLFLLFGRYHCKATSPECSNCRLVDYCKFNKKK